MDGHDIVFFDGTCGLCHRAVRFALRHDPDGSRFRFAPIGGETFASRVGSSSREALPDSVIVLTSDGRLLVRSEASARLLRRIGGAWGVLGVLLGLLPRRLADWGYDWVARHRHGWFSSPASSCPVGPEEAEGRMLA